jgi:hypothetical protein
MYPKGQKLDGDEKRESMGKLIEGIVTEVIMSSRMKPPEGSSF